MFRSPRKAMLHRVREEANSLNKSPMTIWDGTSRSPI